MMVIPSDLFFSSLSIVDFPSPIFVLQFQLLQSKESLSRLVLKDGLYIQSTHISLVAMLSRKKKVKMKYLVVAERSHSNTLNSK